MNGYGITGPNVCTSNPTTCPPLGNGRGVQAGTNGTNGPRGVRIINGSVSGMGREGILMTGTRSFVERVTADSNSGGGITDAGTVIQSAATHNALLESSRLR
jgi:hypothetical protein